MYLWLEILVDLGVRNCVFIVHVFILKAMLHRDTKQIPPASAPSSVPSSIPLSIPQVRLYSMQAGNTHLNTQGNNILICGGNTH